MKRLAGLISAAALVCTVGCSQTDAGISTAVKTRLAANDLVKASDIDVDTRNNVVTLTGAVETAAAKEEAVRIARTTEGVSDVIDRLTLDDTPTATTGVSDDAAHAADRDVDIRVKDDLGDDSAKTRIVVQDDVERNADAAVDGVKKGAHAVKEGAEKAGDATVKGTKKAVGKVKEAVDH
jgi:hypothetical protein